MKQTTRHECEKTTKNARYDSEKRIKKLKKVTKKFEKIIEKTDNALENSIWTKITTKDFAVASSTIAERTVNALSKKKFNKKIKLMSWIKRI